jgi:DNA-binding transcriptional LysR family regulator
MQTKLDWSDVRVLVAFGRTGTLADAARELAMDETTAARRMKRLERALGSPLLTRAGIKLALTPAGRLALDRARAMESAAEDLLRDQAAVSRKIKGNVRITSLGYVLNHVVIPALPNFLTAHPGVSIHIQSDNRNLSLNAGETDIAIRMAAPQKADGLGVKVCDLALAAYRPRNKFQGVPLKRCLWIAPDEELAHTPEAQWLQSNIPADRIVMRSNANICNAAAVKAGMVCAVLPTLIGDNDKDMVRMDAGVCLRREMWLLRRYDDPSTAVSFTASWLTRLISDLAPQLSD